MENPDATGEELCATISTLPCQLSADDTEDFFSLAQYYASRTPQSFRKVWHTMLTAISMHKVYIAFVYTHRTTIAYCLAVVAVWPHCLHTSPTLSVCLSPSLKCWR